MSENFFPTIILLELIAAVTAVPGAQAGGQEQHTTPVSDAGAATEKTGIERNRHFALIFGLPPEIGIDIDNSYFYGFADISILFPAIS